MIRAILIDDEPLALQLLESHIQHTEDIELLHSFTNPIDALQQLEALNPDVIFSDIQMPELTGVQLAKIVANNTPIVFTTAYDQFAVQGFELNAVDYLMKPITLDRFRESVEKIKQRTQQAAIKDVTLDYIFVKSEYKTLKVNLPDINYIKGMADYVTLMLPDRKIHTLENLKHYQTTLPDNFMRIHKSYIINMDKIEFIERNRVVILGDYLPVSETYKKNFFERVKL